MIAILSGVSLLYLTVIVIIPSKNLLSLGFHVTPFMCTTVHARDVAALPNKGDCLWSTCGEWCLSKGSGSCMQIHVMVRYNGSKINFRNCVDILDENCSALDVNMTHPHGCKLGQCKDITGLFNCTREEPNNCRNITPAFNCYSRNISRIAIECTEEKCEERLNGVYSCKDGSCQKLNDIPNYTKNCERKCLKLEMRERNVVIFSRERLVATSCRSIDTPDETSANIESVSNKQEWKDKKEAFMLFCSEVKMAKGSETYDIFTTDCFNATLKNTTEVQHLTNYMDILHLHQNLSASNTTDWIIGPEESLRKRNNTQLRINPDGCVNSLRKECTAFFETHAHDGTDGMTPDRFKCYDTDQDVEYVIGKYDPISTSAMLLVACILPGTLFVIACTCLFFCSKSVGVDDEGHLKVTLLKGAVAGGNASEL
ncbi:hypothetical protein Pmani_019054 [Petrolisthes manimaculis]|uniref:Uncharacterized protein n=1 Tax=Petrolisthes manimaculis TaxID=1843537 RepID=A0AAE1PL97_9EUCA|nr:hypothetical protein Pmani_019054 [Petrolisthes manimaculis]